jgi:hypothetical protein
VTVSRAKRAKGQKMPEINAATGALTIPIWAVGAVAAVFLVLIMMTIAQSGTAVVANTLFRAMIVIGVVLAGWIYVDYTDRQARAAARRALDERSAALAVRAMAPGSMFACLNGLAGEATEQACEKAVFAGPETVSSAVSYVAAQVGLLFDGFSYSVRYDQGYFMELAPLQTALQTDRFGIVAHVFAVTRGCTVEKCESTGILGDPARMLANMRDHVFEANVAKFSPGWNAPHGPVATSGDAPAAVAGRPVSSQYDFPSANSIPPVNIMVPEPGAPAPAPRSAPTGGQPTRPSAAPTRPRPAAARPAAPVAVGEAPAHAAPSSPQ